MKTSTLSQLARNASTTIRFNAISTVKSSSQSFAKTSIMKASNGTANGTPGTIPVTQLLAAFAASVKTSDLTPALRLKVKEVVLDYIGCVAGALTHAESTGPIYSSILALQGGASTDRAKCCTVLGKGPPHFLPQYAGLLNAAFGHSLDFDDTYAAGTLHAGVTAVSAALAQAEISRSTPEELMMAISVGYEITCRLGRETGYEAYARGFHNTSTCGIFGSVAAIAVLKGLSAETVEMAFGLAGSKAAGSMQYLDNGSWNKRLHPGFAVHDAFMCVAMAEAGVIGATRIIEGKSGFLNAYSPNPNKDLDRLVEGLGKKWEWLTSSLKPYPACRMTHGFIELCGDIHDQRTGSSGGKLNPSEFASVNLSMSANNFILVGDPTPNKIHPSNVIDAQFSAYFQVAHMLIHGAKTGDMAPYSRLQDADLRELREKITVQTDDSMGQYSAKMRVKWADGGQEVQTEQQHPLGEVEHPFTRDKVEEKFVTLASPVYGERTAQIIKMIDSLEDVDLAALLTVLQ